MPYTWMIFSTLTADPIKGKTPQAIREYIEGLVDGRLKEVYFDVGKEVGYALFKDLGDSAETKRVSRQIGGLGTTKMLDADQAQMALAGLAPEGPVQA